MQSASLKKRNRERDPKVNTSAAITPTRTNFWLLKLVPPGWWGPWLLGATTFLVIISLFALVGRAFDETAENRIDTGVAFFFATLLAYIVPVHHLIVRRSLAALDQLAPILGADQVTYVAERIVVKPLWWHVTVLAGGLTAGLLHNTLLLGGGQIALAIELPATFLSMLVTILIWIVMTATIASLVQNAVMFKRLAESAEIDVLDTRSLTPFGSIAVSSTLAMIGAQAAFPLLIVGSGTSWVSFAPGLVATGIPMVLLFLLPVLPVHRRIITTKQSVLAQVNADIQALKVTGPPDYPALQPLLTYRREVMDASEWPFDTSVMGRLAIYLIIPPLTWIGAALIEILVEGAI